MPLKSLKPTHGKAPPSKPKATYGKAQPSCAPFAAAVAGLRRERRRHHPNAPRLAVCLTGQLRLFMIGFPALVKNLLLGAASSYKIDVFHVGPADLSYTRGKSYLTQIPGLRASTLYDPKLQWKGASTFAELAEPQHVVSNQSRRSRPVARFNLNGLEQCGSQLKARLVQALQARECLRLIERAEAAGTPSEPPAAASSSAAAPAATAPTSQRYAAVLRLRADMLTLRQTTLPPVSAIGDDLYDAPTYSSLHQCPHKSSRELAPHDFALFGGRDVMGRALSVLDHKGLPLPPRTLIRYGCDAGALAKARLSVQLPNARCVAPLNVTPVASVRGSVSGGCYYLDQEHPPNDGLPQPKLSELFAGAAAVASECLGLREKRDGRRPGSGPACEPRGGWDGDFRDDASPWDVGGPANRGAG